MDLSIIIVNYNSPGLVLDCLRSLEQQSIHVSTEIIVVDNDSKDNSKETITSSFPLVKWIQMSYNSGFARANNEGIRNSTAPVVLLLNPDTLVINNGVSNCYKQFINDSYIACGVQLLNPNSTPQISGSYFMKGGLNHLLPLPYLGPLLRFFALRLKVKKPSLSDVSGTQEVDWINGAFLMVKRGAVNKAGLMDEDFFMYAEEAEWCSRLNKIGKLCIYGDLNVIHLQGETANEAFGSSGKGYQNLFDKKGLQIMVSNLLRIRKQYGVGWFLFILSMFIIDIPVFFAGYTISKLVLSRKYSFRQFKGFTSNVLKLINLSPLIITNRPNFYKV